MFLEFLFFESLFRSQSLAVRVRVSVRVRVRVRVGVRSLEGFSEPYSQLAFVSIPLVFDLISSSQSLSLTVPFQYYM